MGLPEALPFVLIIVVMFVVGKSLPERGTAIEGRLQTVPQARRMHPCPRRRAGHDGGGPLRCLGRLPGALINSMIGAVVCLSLVVITGYVGQISLLQMALAGLAGYMLAGLTTGMGIPFPMAPILAALGAMVVGLVAALPALRVRGVNLAVITFAAGWAIERFVFNNPDYTGGFEGASVPPPELFGVEVALLLRPHDRPTESSACSCWVVLALARDRRVQPSPERRPAAACWRCARTSGRRPRWA